MEILEILAEVWVRTTVLLIKLLVHLVAWNWDIIEKAFRTREDNHARREE